MYCAVKKNPTPVSVTSSSFPYKKPRPEKPLKRKMFSAESSFVRERHSAGPTLLIFGLTKMPSSSLIKRPTNRLPAVFSVRFRGKSASLVSRQLFLERRRSCSFCGGGIFLLKNFQNKNQKKQKNK